MWSMSLKIKGLQFCMSYETSIKGRPSDSHTVWSATSWFIFLNPPLVPDYLVSSLKQIEPVVDRATKVS